jgi:hypothetical protein
MLAKAYRCPPGQGKPEIQANDGGNTKTLIISYLRDFLSCSVGLLLTLLSSDWMTNESGEYPKSQARS